ncbi:MAG TPA: hypothetical protein VGS22_19300 [Thermoanaerobaculia bacterium]|jgi:hypothetical protein|nr:hypothetical protein [Thermoanaerobaculia bacterium]
MEPIVDPRIEARMRATLDLYEFAETMMRENLRRRFPAESDAQRHLRFIAWRQKRPWAGPIPPPNPAKS